MRPSGSNSERGTAMTKQDKVLRGVADWCAFYRANPHRFAKDYLHLDLKLFQKILIVMMSISTNTAFIGARGIGKTFLSAVFCVIQAVLYPGSKICIASGTRGQSLNVLEKIMLELKPRSPELALEIDEKQTRINGTNAQIVFKNTSYIKVVTASDTARGNRATILLLDEFRMIPKDVVTTILKKFLTQKRMPDYAELSKEERAEAYKKERHQTLYLSSAFLTDNWSYTLCQDTFSNMIDKGWQQFVCGLPYQLSIAEGLLDPSTVEEEMAESNFSEIKFNMEYAALFWGSSDGAFFDFSSISKNRRIKYAILPDKFANKLGNSPLVRIPHKQPGELRLLSADVALMASTKHDNDAASIFINQMLPTKAGRYMSNIVYAASMEGMHTLDLSMYIRRMYEEYQCDYIVLDTAGAGIGCYDMLVRDMSDPETGEIFPALSCCNDPAMAARCTVPGADKVIWSIKASATFNSDCAFLLREAFRSGRMRLLVTEYDAEELLKDIKGYNSLNPAEKFNYQLPYLHTTLLVDELINLRHEEVGSKIKIKEKYGMRKDRYSSLSYNYYVATQLENKMSRRRAPGYSASDVFLFRAPKIK